MATGLSGYHVFAILLGSWGQLGVDLFIIIGIYFMSKCNQFRSKKAVSLVFETAFYAIFWYIISWYGFQIQVGKGELIRQIFGVFMGTHWFITAYLLLYIFHPILNCIIDKLNKKQIQQVTILLTVFVSIYKTIYSRAPVCDFLFFVNIYFIINCIEKTDFKRIINNSGSLALLTFVSLTSINLLILIIGQFINSDLIKEHSIYLNHRGSIFVLMVAIFIFYAIKGLHHIESRTINIIASTSLGVYLSHQGISQNVWKALFIDDTLSGINACLHMTFSVIVIFVCCVLIDLIRQYTFEILLVKILDCKRISFVLSWVDNFINVNEPQLKK
ncbi:MAG: acyltransferase family protein [Acetatifactor sp.]|nr:acyltransferase family protein [Acetatifactor sp.]